MMKTIIAAAIATMALAMGSASAQTVVHKEVTVQKDNGMEMHRDHGMRHHRMEHRRMYRHRMYGHRHHMMMNDRPVMRRHVSKDVIDRHGDMKHVEKDVVKDGDTKTVTKQVTK